MTFTKWLEAVRLRLDAATPNYRRAPILKSDWPEKFNDVASVRGVRIIGDYRSNSCGQEADLIINAPTDLKIALDLIETLIEELHHASTSRQGVVDGLELDSLVENRMKP